MAQEAGVQRMGVRRMGVGRMGVRKMGHLHSCIGGPCQNAGSYRSHVPVTAF